MTLTEFLLARIAEDEAAANSAHRESMRGTAGPGFVRSRVAWVAQAEGVRGVALIERFTPARVLAECEAKRRIVAWHENWPVLVDSPPEVEEVDAGPDSFAFRASQRFAFRASQRIAWLTEREYVARFGEDPPSGPILRLLALPYADHPDYDETWRP